MNFAKMFRKATNKDRDKIFVSSVAFLLTETGFQVDADWMVLSVNQKSRMVALESLNLKTGLKFSTIRLNRSA